MNISLRGVERSDIANIARLADNRDIAKMTANLPYPYTLTDAHTWFDYVQNTDREHVFVICIKKDMAGVVGLVHEPEHDRAELGYWLSVPYWHNGYMSAAVEIAVAYAWGVLGVSRLYAYCYSDNHASARVLEKNGFVREGCQMQHCIRMGQKKDVLCFGLLKGDK